MQEPLLLTLPYGPSVNQFHAIFNNRIITSRDGRAYQKLVGDALRRAGVLPFDGEVEVKIDLFRPQKSGDLDNRFKPIFDCLRSAASSGGATTTSTIRGWNLRYGHWKASR